MVAYSFKPQFRAPILAGTKRQTIRADRKRHARPGEVMQLYTGMRTKACSLIGVAMCQDVSRIRLGIERQFIEVRGIRYDLASDGRMIEGFAVADGFASWSAMRAFWQREHPDQDVFEGVLVQWWECVVAPSDCVPAGGLSKLRR